YKGALIDCGHRVDVVVGGRILLELKPVEQLLPIHQAQVVTYMRLANLPVGLLVNFNVAAPSFSSVARLRGRCAAEFEWSAIKRSLLDALIVHDGSYPPAAGRDDPFAYATAGAIAGCIAVRIAGNSE